MADKSARDTGGCNKSGGQGGDGGGNNLEDFVTGHYKKQREAGTMDSTDEQRTNDFFARAIGESRRMNAEVNKSNKKLDALHAEFGLDMVNAWQAEHSSEVLAPHEQQLVKNAQYQSPNAGR